MNSKNLTVAAICNALQTAMAKRHDILVIRPSGDKTIFVASSCGLGHALDELFELPIALTAIEIDLWEVLRLDGWNVKRDGSGYAAKRRSSSSSTISMAA